jgi:hypothetical protein
MRLLLAWVLLIFGATSALAADDTSAQALLDKCNLTPVVEKITKFDAGFCMGMIVTVMSIGPDLAPDYRFCPEDRIPIRGIGTLAHYLKEHPELKTVQALAVLALAYREAWPCKE